MVIDEQIERKLAYYVKEKGVKNIVLKVSPILGAYLTRGIFNSYLSKWKKKYKCKIKVEEITGYSVLQYEFYNEKEEALD